MNYFHVIRFQHYLTDEVNMSLTTTSEVLDHAYVRDAVQAIICPDDALPLDKELDKHSIDALVQLLANRFEYIRHSPLIYTENTTSPTNQFCIAIATALQYATGKNRFQLLMPSIKSTTCITGMDLNDKGVAVTDFILDDTQEYIIDIEESLRLAENTTKLLHTQRLNENGNGELILSDAMQARLLARSSEVRKYYDAIVKRHAFKRNGETLGALLQTLVDCMVKGSAGHQGEETNAGFTANEAIYHFDQIYQALPDERKKWLDSLSPNNESSDDDASSLGKIWHVLTVQQHEAIDSIRSNPALSAAKKQMALNNVHLTINTCTKINSSKLQAIINKHQEALFAITIDNQVLQDSSIHLYDEAVANARHWFNTQLLHLRQNKAQLVSAISKEQDTAITQAVLNKANKPLLTKLVTQLRVFPKIKRITAGAGHTFILTETGKLYACGANSCGQLGLEDHTTRDRPTEVASIPGKVAQVVAGDNHTLILTEAGKLYSCGNNYFGELGLGDNTTRNRPTEVTHIPDKIVQVIAGGNHTLILTEGGKLYSCGNNNHGQLGLGDSTDRNTPTEVTGIPGKITQVVAGDAHTLILTESGKLYGCGENNRGQLGIGDVMSRNRPTEVNSITIGASKITQVFVGAAYTFILTETGKLYACGANAVGPLGLGDCFHRQIPTIVTRITEKIAQISAGRAHTLILTESAKLYICGANSTSLLGLENGDYMYYSTPNEITTIASKITQISVGRHHGFILTEAGKLYSYGDNHHGQLGLGDSEHRNLPTEVPIFAKQTNLLQVLEKYLETTTSLSAASSSTLFARTPEAMQTSTTNHTPILVRGNIIGYFKH